MKQPAWSATPHTKLGIAIYPGDASTPLRPQELLGAMERQVFDVLTGYGRAMTIHQLRLSVNSAPEELEAALAALIGMSLISQLNTVVPSYFANDPGLRRDGE